MASGYMNQYSPATKAEHKTTLADFQFKSIGQAPDLLRRITTPDPEIPMSPSPPPSSPDSPNPYSVQELQPERHIKQKVSLIDRLTGVVPAPQPAAAHTGQFDFTTGPSRPNTQQPTESVRKPRGSFSNVPLHSSSSNATLNSQALPIMGSAPKATSSDIAMDVDTPTNAGTSLQQKGVLSSKSENSGNHTAALASSSARPTNQPSAVQTPALKADPSIAVLRDHLQRISETLLDFPTVDTEEAERLSDAMKAQSAAVLESAESAHQLASKALACAKESMQSAQDCLSAAQLINARADEAIGVVKALGAPIHAEKRAQFVATIQSDVQQLRQAVDKIEERDAKRQHDARVTALQRQNQAAPKATLPAMAVLALPVQARSPTAVLPPGVPTRAKAVDNEAAVRAREEARATKAQQELDRQREDPIIQKLETMQATIAAQQEVIDGMVAAARSKRNMTSLGDDGDEKQNADEKTTPDVQANVGIRPRQDAEHRTTDDRMAVDDDEEEVQKQLQLQAEEPPTVVPDARKRLVRERLEAEKLEASRKRLLAEENKPKQQNSTSEDEKRLQEEETLRQRAVLRANIMFQKKVVIADEAKTINAKRALKQLSPPNAHEATSSEISPPAREQRPKPIETKPRQASNTASGTVALGGAKETTEAKKKDRRTVADAEHTDRLVHRVDSKKSRTPGHSKANSVSPTYANKPLPTDIDDSRKGNQNALVSSAHQVNDLSNKPCSNHSSAGVAVSQDSNPDPYNVKDDQVSRQRVSAPHQTSSVQVSNIQETQVMPIIKRDPDAVVTPSEPQWYSKAPMTPDSLSSEFRTGHNGRTPGVATPPPVKRESSGIPRLSLPSPPPASSPPPRSAEVLPLVGGQEQQQQQQNIDTHLQRKQEFKAAHTIAAVTQAHKNPSAANVPESASVQQIKHVQTHNPSGSKAGLPPIASLPQRPPPLAKLSAPELVFAPRPHYPSVSHGVADAMECDPMPRIPLDSGRGEWDQHIPESYNSSNNLANDRSVRGRPIPRPQRRIGVDHYSPSPPLPPLPSGPANGRIARPPARVDHYSPRRSPSPITHHQFRYPVSRSRSRGPMSGGNSRNSTPGYSPKVTYIEPTFNQNRKRSYTGDNQQGPPPRRPRMDGEEQRPREQLAPRSYAVAQSPHEDWSRTADRAPSPVGRPDHRGLPLENRLEPPISPPHGPQLNRPKQAAHHSYVNRNNGNRQNQPQPYHRGSPHNANTYYDGLQQQKQQQQHQFEPAASRAIDEDDKVPVLLGRMGTNPTHNSPSDYHRHNTNNKAGRGRGRGAMHQTASRGKNLVDRIDTQH